jgi:hypothetical protein
VATWKVRLAALGARSLRFKVKEKERDGAMYLELHNKANAAIKRQLDSRLAKSLLVFVW